MSANKLPAADAAAFCAKQIETRSDERRRQAGVVRNKQGLLIAGRESFQPPASNNCRFLRQFACARRPRAADYLR
jgi:hypothetical protein